MAYLFSITLAALLLARQSGAFVPVAARRSVSFAKMGMSATETTSVETDETSNNIGAIGSKLTDMELAKEALSMFLNYSADGLEIIPTSGGVNNIVQYVTLPSGEKELLRIYNNGCDTQRVKFEHEILRQLNEQTLSFSVPCFLPSKEGSTIVRLGNGADACMVKLIPGHLPKLTCAGDIGRAAGELNTALTKIDVDSAMCNCAPYWKMYDVHHAVTRELFEQEMRGPNFDGEQLRGTADRMLQETLDIADRCEGVYQSLPIQLIHGDLHYDNVLVQDGKVTALLDFEFASFDWRAMELAICLSKYAGEEPDAKPYFDDFIKGFAKHGKLTKAEAKAIPDLINLRILSNIVYFVGRHIAGEDNISSITSRIQNYERRVNWVKSNGDAISGRIIEEMRL
jgi:homoserine kinase type II